METERGQASPSLLEDMTVVVDGQEPVTLYHDRHNRFLKSKRRAHLLQQAYNISRWNKPTYKSVTHKTRVLSF
jgi:hypothetical protein